jgi:uncharacterized membrane protein
MGTNPNQGQNPNQPDPYGTYGGYSGYTPQNPADDPYSSRQYGPATGTNTSQNDPNYVYGQGVGYGQQQQQQTYGQQQQQQYGAYVPPTSVSGGARNAYGPISQQSRTRALLSYLVLFFSGIVMFFVGRRDRFVRFNAAQSITLFLPLFIVSTILKLIAIIPIIGFLLGGITTLLSTILFIIGAILWVFLMVQSYRGVTVRLPIVAEYADSLVARFSKKGSI